MAEHQVELLLLYNKFLLAIYFTYSNIYVSVLLSQFILHSPSPTVSTSMFSMTLTLFYRIGVCMLRDNTGLLFISVVFGTG